jgi:uncharacterized protein YodC (DUF2158 family)
MPVADVLEISEGDVVRLKSGGPPMTVTEVDSGLGQRLVFVVWFDSNNELRSGTFPAGTLEKN